MAPNATAADAMATALCLVEPGDRAALLDAGPCTAAYVTEADGRFSVLGGRHAAPSISG